MFALCFQLARFIQSKVWKHSHLLAGALAKSAKPAETKNGPKKNSSRITTRAAYGQQFLPSIWNPTPPTKTRHGMCFKKNATKRVHPFTYFRRKRQSPASLTLTFLQDVWGSVLRPNCRNLLESPLQRRPS